MSLKVEIGRQFASMGCIVFLLEHECGTAWGARTKEGRLIDFVVPIPKVFDFDRDQMRNFFAPLLETRAKEVDALRNFLVQQCGTSNTAITARNTALNSNLAGLDSTKTETKQQNPIFFNPLNKRNLKNNSPKAKSKRIVHPPSTDWHDYINSGWRKLNCRLKIQ